MTDCYDSKESNARKGKTSEEAKKPFR